MVGEYNDGVLGEFKIILLGVKYYMLGYQLRKPFSVVWVMRIITGRSERGNQSIKESFALNILVRWEQFVIMHATVFEDCQVSYH